jgi:hypothetical protein
MVRDWSDLGVWEERRKELLREAEGRRLAQELREARMERRSGGAPFKVPDGIEVRWGLLEDEPRVAEILELNGMPRWIAFEERYIVAEKDGELLAAMRYLTEKERLSLGLLISDPWAEERPLAVALYVGAGKLAREMGIGEVIARPFPYVDEDPREAGYRRRGRREWRLDATRRGEIHGEPVAGRWQRLFELLGATPVPFVGLLRG